MTLTEKLDEEKKQDEANDNYCLHLDRFYIGFIYICQNKTRQLPRRASM